MQLHDTEEGKTMIFKKLAANLCMVGALFSPIAHALDSDEVRKVPSWDLVGRILKLAGGGEQVRQEVSVLHAELWARADAGRADAMFARAFYQFQVIKHSGVKDAKCSYVLDEAKKVATNEKIKILWDATAAMDLVGEMYETGICAQKSKYIAVDWYIRAGNQLRENEDRDAALRAMEKALNLVPDHPQAMKLREALLR